MLVQLGALAFDVTVCQSACLRTSLCTIDQITHFGASTNLGGGHILLPRYQRGGPYAGQLIWRKPTQAALSEILHNPAYAGDARLWTQGSSSQPTARPTAPDPVSDGRMDNHPSRDVSCVYHVGAVSRQLGAPGSLCQRFRTARSWGPTTGLRALHRVSCLWTVWLPDAGDRTSRSDATPVRRSPQTMVRQRACMSMALAWKQ